MRVIVLLIVAVQMMLCPMLSIGDSIDKDGVFYESKFDSLLPLSKEDHEILKSHARFLQSVYRSIVQAKESGAEYYVDTEELSRVLEICHIIISKSKEGIFFPDIAWPLHGVNQSDRANPLGNMYVGMLQFANNSSEQFRTMRSVLWHDAKISCELDDCDSVIEILLLMDRINDSLQLTGTLSCILLYDNCSDIVAFSRHIYGDCSPKQQKRIRDVLTRTRKHLGILVRELLVTAKNETIFSLPVLLSMEDENGFGEAVKHVTYFEDIEKNAQEYFDLEKGPIYYVDISTIIEPLPPDFRWKILFMKTQVQFYRDRCAHLVSLIDSVIDSPFACESLRANDKPDSTENLRTEGEQDLSEEKYIQNAFQALSRAEKEFRRQGDADDSVFLLKQRIEFYGEEKSFLEILDQCDFIFKSQKRPLLVSACTVFLGTKHRQATTDNTPEILPCYFIVYDAYRLFRLASKLAIDREEIETALSYVSIVGSIASSVEAYDDVSYRLHYQISAGLVDLYEAIIPFLDEKSKKEAYKTLERQKSLNTQALRAFIFSKRFDVIQLLTDKSLELSEESSSLARHVFLKLNEIVSNETFFCDNLHDDKALLEVMNAETVKMLDITNRDNSNETLHDLDNVLPAMSLDRYQLFFLNRRINRIQAFLVPASKRNTTP